MTDRYTVAYEFNGALHKLCKVIYGRDGSYYVTSPYHPSKRALLAKLTVDYSKPELLLPIGDAIDVAVADDDERRIKLSHHLDGFVQFSGQGIVSGRDPTGIRGIGVMSWPLSAPPPGPAFGVTVRGIDTFETAPSQKGAFCVFHHQDLMSPSLTSTWFLEGHFFQARYRRFVYVNSGGHPEIGICHPSGALIRLRALLPPASFPGFLGLELYAADSSADLPTPSFALSSSTGNLRTNAHGSQLGDGLFCVYPALSATGRSLNYF